ncbi:hypothetical protein HPC49_29635 [Pyxidicoccus fallax]|nr:hypothetical protein [Pyxidicoccus fallax]
MATRITEFPFRPSTQRYGHDGRTKWKDDPGGTGPQIVRELRVCATCVTARQQGRPMMAH